MDHPAEATTHAQQGNIIVILYFIFYFLFFNNNNNTYSSTQVGREVEEFEGIAHS